MSFNKESGRWLCDVLGEDSSIFLRADNMVLLGSKSADADALADILFQAGRFLWAECRGSNLNGMHGATAAAGIAFACVLSCLGPVQFKLLELVVAHVSPEQDLQASGLLGALQHATMKATGMLSMALFWTCAAVFVLWHTLPPTFMQHHFILSWRNFQHGRWWTILTCEVSHNDLPHLLANMSGLLGAAPNLALSEHAIQFAGFLLASAAMSSALSLYGWRAAADKEMSSLGASGVVCGLFTVQAIRAPRASVWLYGMHLSSRSALVVQMVVECILGVLIAKQSRPSLFGVDLESIMGFHLQKVRGVDVFGHLGGTIAGLVYCLLVPPAA
mmetsp:Transcript_15642/g.45738  ORF Transcript_15642/g.45738 Transcript_15642/m.45738 type:complete len:331 (+) Transcript_15642:91-1083(+)